MVAWGRGGWLGQRDVLFYSSLLSGMVGQVR